MNIERVLLKLEASIMEVLNSHLRKSVKKEGSFSFWDRCMKNNWSKLINPPIIDLKINKEVRGTYNWVPPPHGQFKLNFNGATRGNLGVLGIGCIVNNDSRKWVGKLASPIPPTSNNLVELEALDKGLQLCIILRVSKVIIEGVSLIILNAIRNQETPIWILNSKLKEVLTRLDSFEKFQICHIF